MFSCFKKIFYKTGSSQKCVLWRRNIFIFVWLPVKFNKQFIKLN